MQKHSPTPWALGPRVSLEDLTYHPAGGQDYRVILDNRGDPIALVLDDLGDDECAANVEVFLQAAKNRIALGNIALMNLEGDEVEEGIGGGEVGGPYEMTIDDAFDAAEQAIKSAREVLGWGDPAKDKIYGPDFTEAPG